MFAAEREQLILNYLTEHELASTGTLASITGASIATIRRDLNAMNQKGLLKKTHGGAQRISSLPSSAIIPAVHSDSASQAKEYLAKTAANFIQPGDIIFLGAGETCTLLAKYIKNKENLTVVTTNLNAIFELSNASSISILMLGGDIHVGVNYIETLGEDVLTPLHKLYFDKVFFTINGADLEYGYSIFSRLQLPLYEYLMKACNECYLMINDEKFGKRTFIQFCSLDKFPNIIAQPTIPKDYLEYYLKHGVNVYTDFSEK